MRYRACSQDDLKHELVHFKPDVMLTECINVWNLLLQSTGIWQWTFLSLMFSIYLAVHISLACILQMWQCTYLPLIVFLVWQCTFLSLIFSLYCSAQFFSWFSADVAVYISYTGVIQMWQHTFVSLIFSRSKQIQISIGQCLHTCEMEMTNADFSNVSQTV
jgi:hypothetical protein